MEKTVSTFNNSTGEIELQEAKLAKKENWHRRFFMELEPKPIKYFINDVRQPDILPDDYGQEARL